MWNRKQARMLVIDAHVSHASSLESRFGFSEHPLEILLLENVNGILIIEQA